MTAEPLVIEHIRPADHEAVAELTGRAYEPSGLTPDDDYYWVLRDVDARLAAGATVLAARQGDAVLGTITWCPPGCRLQEVARDGESELRVLAVAPDAHGRGVGRALVEHAIGLSVAVGHRAVVLSSAGWMQVAQGMYRRMGFEHLPERDWSPRPDLLITAYGLRLRSDWDPAGR